MKESSNEWVWEVRVRTSCVYRWGSEHLHQVQGETQSWGKNTEAQRPWKRRGVWTKTNTKTRFKKKKWKWKDGQRPEGRLNVRVKPARRKRARSRKREGCCFKISTDEWVPGPWRRRAISSVCLSLSVFMPASRGRYRLFCMCFRAWLYCVQRSSGDFR